MLKSEKIYNIPDIKHCEVKTPSDYQEEMLFVWKQKLLSKISEVLA